MKTGSNIAARYSASMGDVEEDAIMLPGNGTLPSCFVASDPFLTPSICKSIHHIPGIPSIIQSIAFFKRIPSGNHWRKRKYVVETVKKKGNLNKKRNICSGSHTRADIDVTGKNGAIPDPRAYASANTTHVIRISVPRRTSISKLRVLLHICILRLRPAQRSWW